MIYFGNIYHMIKELNETLHSAFAKTTATLFRVPHRSWRRYILYLEHDFVHTDIVDKQ